jgi:subtilisin-like proprotein convertase family protein
MKTLNKLVIVAVTGVMLGLGQTALATLSDFTLSGYNTYTGGGSSLSQMIPDNTYAGVGYTINFTDGSVNIASLTVSLNTSGGYNGDIYAYISHNGILVQLLNPNGAVGGSGMDLTLGTTGSTLPTSGTLTSGSYISFGDLTAFNNVDASGDWTVFFADLGAGDTSILNSFTINLTAVPEPVTVALGGFAVILLATAVLKRFRRTQPANN